MRIRYEEELRALHEQLVHMGGLCEEAVALAVRALTKNDAALTQRVLDADARIDRAERDVEAMCLRLLLRQQPVASDLRRVSAALKMISDMERIGDQAGDIAELSSHIAGRLNGQEEDLTAMAVAAVGMVTDAVDAYVKCDLALARAVIARDDVVDDWFSRIRAELVARIAADAAHGSECLDIMMAAKYLERIADHATNIGEWVEYAVTGARSKNGVYPDDLTRI